MTGGFLWKQKSFCSQQEVNVVCGTGYSGVGWGGGGGGGTSSASSHEEGVDLVTTHS